MRALRQICSLFLSLLLTFNPFIQYSSSALEGPLGIQLSSSSDQTSGSGDTGGVIPSYSGSGFVSPSSLASKFTDSPISYSSPILDSYKADNIIKPSIPSESISSFANVRLSDAGFAGVSITDTFKPVIPSEALGGFTPIMPTAADAGIMSDRFDFATRAGSTIEGSFNRDILSNVQTGTVSSATLSNTAFSSVMNTSSYNLVSTGNWQPNSTLTSQLDFDGNAVFNSADVSTFTSSVNSGVVSASMDLNADSVVNQADVNLLNSLATMRQASMAQQVTMISSVSPAIGAAVISSMTQSGNAALAGQILTQLSAEKAASILNNDAITTDTATAILGQVQNNQAARIMGEIRANKAADILAAGTPGNSAAILAQMTDPGQAATILENMRTQNAVDIINSKSFEPPALAEVFGQMDTQIAGMLIASVETPKAVSVMELLNDKQHLASILQGMPANVIAKIIADPTLDLSRAGEMMNSLQPETAGKVLNSVAAANQGLPRAASILKAMQAEKAGPAMDHVETAIGASLLKHENLGLKQANAIIRQMQPETVTRMLGKATAVNPDAADPANTVSPATAFRDYPVLTADSRIPDALLSKTTGLNIEGTLRVAGVGNIVPGSGNIAWADMPLRAPVAVASTETGNSRTAVITLVDGTVLRSQPGNNKTSNYVDAAGNQWASTEGGMVNLTVKPGDTFEIAEGVTLTATQSCTMAVSRAGSIAMPSGTVLTDEQGRTWTCLNGPRDMQDYTIHDAVGFVQTSYKAGDTITLNDKTVLTAAKDFNAANGVIPAGTAFTSNGRQWVAQADGQFLQTGYKKGDAFGLADGTVLTANADFSLGADGTVPKNVNFLDRNSQSWVSIDNGVVAKVRIDESKQAPAGVTISLDNPLVWTPQLEHAALWLYTYTYHQLPPSQDILACAVALSESNVSNWQANNYEGADQIQTCTATINGKQYDVTGLVYSAVYVPSPFEGEEGTWKVVKSSDLAAADIGMEEITGLMGLSADPATDEHGQVIIPDFVRYANVTFSADDQTFYVPLQAILVPGQTPEIGASCSALTIRKDSAGLLGKGRWSYNGNSFGFMSWGAVDQQARSPARSEPTLEERQLAADANNPYYRDYYLVPDLQEKAAGGDVGAQQQLNYVYAVTGGKNPDGTTIESLKPLQNALDDPYYRDNYVLPGLIAGSNAGDTGATMDLLAILSATGGRNPDGTQIEAFKPILNQPADNGVAAAVAQTIAFQESIGQPLSDREIRLLFQSTYEGQTGQSLPQSVLDTLASSSGTTMIAVDDRGQLYKDKNTGAYYQRTADGSLGKIMVAGSTSDGNTLTLQGQDGTAYVVTDGILTVNGQTQGMATPAGYYSADDVNAEVRTIGILQAAAAIPGTGAGTMQQINNQINQSARNINDMLTAGIFDPASRTTTIRTSDRITVKSYDAVGAEHTQSVTEGYTITNANGQQQFVPFKQYTYLANPDGSTRTVTTLYKDDGTPWTVQDSTGASGKYRNYLDAQNYEFVTTDANGRTLIQVYEQGKLAGQYDENRHAVVLDPSGAIVYSTDAQGAVVSSNGTDYSVAAMSEHVSVSRSTEADAPVQYLNINGQSMALSSQTEIEVIGDTTIILTDSQDPGKQVTITLDAQGNVASMVGHQSAPGLVEQLNIGLAAVIGGITGGWANGMQEGAQAANNALNPDVISIDGVSFSTTIPGTYQGTVNVTVAGSDGSKMYPVSQQAIQDDPGMFNFIYGNVMVTYTDGSGKQRTGWVSPDMLKPSSLVTLPNEISVVTQSLGYELNAEGEFVASYRPSDSQAADVMGAYTYWNDLPEETGAQRQHKAVVAQYLLGQAEGDFWVSLASGWAGASATISGQMNAVVDQSVMDNVQQYLDENPVDPALLNSGDQAYNAGLINSIPAPLSITTLRAIPSVFIDSSEWNAYTETANASGQSSVVSAGVNKNPLATASYTFTPQTYTWMDLASDAALVLTLVSPLIGDEALAIGSRSMQVADILGGTAETGIALSSAGEEIFAAGSRGMQAGKLIQGAARSGAVWAGVSAASDNAYSLISGQGLSSLEDTVQSARHGYGQGFIFSAGLQGLGLTGVAGRAGNYLLGTESGTGQMAGRYLLGVDSRLGAYALAPETLAADSLRGAGSFVFVGPVFHTVGWGLGNVWEGLTTGDWSADEMIGPHGEEGLPWYQDLLLSAASSPKDTGLWLGPLTEVAGLTTSTWDPAGTGRIARWAQNTGTYGYFRGTARTLLGRELTSAGEGAVQKSWLTMFPTTPGAFLRSVDDAVFFSGFTAGTNALLFNDVTQSTLGMTEQDAQLLGWLPFFAIPRYGGSVSLDRPADSAVRPTDAEVYRNGESAYDILKVNRDATPAEINKAYRAQTKQYHPDVNPAGSERMIDINWAYERIGKDTSARVAYDEALSNRPVSGSRTSSASAEPQPQKQVDNERRMPEVIPATNRLIDLEMAPAGASEAAGGEQAAGSKQQAQTAPAKDKPAVIKTQRQTAEEAWSNSLSAEADYPQHQTARVRAIQEYCDYIDRSRSDPEWSYDYMSQAYGVPHNAQSMYSRFIRDLYSSARHTSYNPRPSEDPAIADRASKPRLVNGEEVVSTYAGEGFIYRLPADRDTADISGTDWRFSVNALAQEGLIESLDGFMLKYPELVNRYKTPATAGHWYDRYDPVTVYLSERPGAQQIEDFVAALKPYVRDTRDVLIGENLSPGISLDREWSHKYEEYAALAERANALDPALGRAAQNYYEMIGTSSGIYFAIEEVINRASGAGMRLSPGEKKNSGNDVFRRGLEFEQGTANSRLKDLSSGEIGDLASRLTRADYGTHERVLMEYMEQRGTPLSQSEAGGIITLCLGGPIVPRAAGVEKNSVAEGTSIMDRVQSIASRLLNRATAPVPEETSLPIERDLEHRLVTLQDSNNKTGQWLVGILREPSVDPVGRIESVLLNAVRLPSGVINGFNEKLMRVDATGDVYVFDVLSGQRQADGRINWLPDAQIDFATMNKNIAETFSGTSLERMKTQVVAAAQQAVVNLQSPQFRDRIVDTLLPQIESDFQKKYAGKPEFFRGNVHPTDVLVRLEEVYKTELGLPPAGNGFLLNSQFNHEGQVVNVGDRQTTGILGVTVGEVEMTAAGVVRTTNLDRKAMDRILRNLGEYITQRAGIAPAGDRDAAQQRSLLENDVRGALESLLHNHMDYASSTTMYIRGAKDAAGITEKINEVFVTFIGVKLPDLDGVYRVERDGSMYLFDVRVGTQGSDGAIHWLSDKDIPFDRMNENMGRHFDGPEIERLSAFAQKNAQAACERLNNPVTRQRDAQELAQTLHDNFINLKKPNANGKSFLGEEYEGNVYTKDMIGVLEQFYKDSLGLPRDGDFFSKYYSKGSVVNSGDRTDVSVFGVNVGINEKMPSGAVRQNIEVSAEQMDRVLQNMATAIAGRAGLNGANVPSFQQPEAGNVRADARFPDQSSVSIEISPMIAEIASRAEFEGLEIAFGGGTARRMVLGGKQDNGYSDIDLIVRPSATANVVLTEDEMGALRDFKQEIEKTFGVHADIVNLEGYVVESQYSGIRNKAATLDRLSIYRDNEGGWKITDETGGSYKQDVLNNNLRLTKSGDFDYRAVLRFVRQIGERPQSLENKDTQDALNEISAFVDSGQMKTGRGSFIKINWLIGGTIMGDQETLIRAKAFPVSDMLKMYLHAQDPHQINNVLKQIGTKRSLYNVLSPLADLEKLAEITVTSRESGKHIALSDFDNAFPEDMRANPLTQKYDARGWADFVYSGIAEELRENVDRAQLDTFVEREMSDYLSTVDSMDISRRMTSNLIASSKAMKDMIEKNPALSQNYVSLSGVVTDDFYAHLTQNADAIRQAILAGTHKNVLDYYSSAYRPQLENRRDIFDRGIRFVRASSNPDNPLRGLSDEAIDTIAQQMSGASLSGKDLASQMQKALRDQGVEVTVERAGSIAAACLGGPTEAQVKQAEGELARLKQLQQRRAVSNAASIRSEAGQREAVKIDAEISAQIARLEETVNQGRAEVKQSTVVPQIPGITPLAKVAVEQAFTSTGEDRNLAINTIIELTGKAPDVIRAQLQVSGKSSQELKSLLSQDQLIRLAQSEAGRALFRIEVENRPDYVQQRLAQADHAILQPVDFEREVQLSGLSAAQIAAMRAKSAGVISIYDYLENLASFRNRDGEALGITTYHSQDDYSALALAGDLKEWMSEYDRRYGDREDHTTRYLNEITSEGRPIVFFVPEAVLGDSKVEQGSVTSHEMQWFLDHPEQMKNVYFVFGAYQLIRDSDYQSLFHDARPILLEEQAHRILAEIYSNYRDYQANP
ncbi:MAG TPA: DnaJ domain-containing protein [Candidatus Omnitrophota bacterium]|nr:DnaJ domain-containing protein [Candidatus Omnitrophota bacterium]